MKFLRASLKNLNEIPQETLINVFYEWKERLRQVIKKMVNKYNKKYFDKI